MRRFDPCEFSDDQILEDRPAWLGTLVCDRYSGYDSVLDKRAYPQRVAAHCAAHARRKFDELLPHRWHKPAV